VALPGGRERLKIAAETGIGSIDCGHELQRLLVVVLLLAPTYNVARGEFVIEERKREIRPTRKLSGFLFFWAQRS
jgi:hypothetical protein